MPERTTFSLREVLASVAAGEQGPGPDPQVAADLRQWFDAEVTDLVAALPDEARPLLTPKRRVADVLACERSVLANLGVTPPVERVAPGQIVDRLVHGHVLGLGTGGDDPLGFALDALRAEGADEVVAWVEGLDPAGRSALADRAVAVAEALARQWGPVDPAWWARCEVPVSVDLAGGAVRCGGRFDVVFGGRPTGLPLVVVEVKAGAAQPHQRADLFWYALLAAWGWDDPPALVATWSAADAALAPEPVTMGTLEAAARRGLDAIGRLVRLAAGGEPQATPGGRCSWCAALDRCGPGLDHLRAGTAADGADGPFDDDDGTDDGW